MLSIVVPGNPFLSITAESASKNGFTSGIFSGLIMHCKLSSLFLFSLSQCALLLIPCSNTASRVAANPLSGQIFEVHDLRFLPLRKKTVVAIS